jgi:hypothetical protein
MKKVIYFIVIALSISANSQNLFTGISIDPGNSIYGSQHNDPGIDLQLRTYAQVSQHIEIGLQVELFPKIEYANVLFNTNYYTSLSPSFEGAVGLEGGQIIRKGTRPGHYHGFFTYGANAELRYKLSDHFLVSAKSNVQRRPDVVDLNWRLSTYVGLIYKIK